MSYHRNVHYNSVVNPNKATIGVGLGLPAYKPGVRGQGQGGGQSQAWGGGGFSLLLLQVEGAQGARLCWGVRVGGWGYAGIEFCLPSPYESELCLPSSYWG